MIKQTETRDTCCDRELLELAAKAVGIDYWVVRFAPRSAPVEKLHITENGETVEWNPLVNDGQALRLAVKLGMQVYVGTHTVVAEICSDSEEPPILGKVFVESDPYVATRRAIVRAAAEIGKAI